MGSSIGLYRANGVGVIDEKPQKADNIKKKLCEILKENGLKITAIVNSKIAHFLDVTLNLIDGTHKVYNKPQNTLQYVNKRSNHPPKVIENIPASINKRLTQLSSNKKMFDNATNIYQDAITKSGYSFKLQYQPEQHYNQPKTRRKRNIIWYTPPYNKRVINNIGKTFLHLIDKEFTKDHPLHKLFNRNNVKISYSCMSNIKQTINMHNKNLLKPNLTSKTQDYVTAA